MFRSRFSDAFPKSLPHYGPQDIENGVVSATPGEQVERLLCALLGLVLNRKKEVEYVPRSRGSFPRARLHCPLPESFIMTQELISTYASIEEVTLVVRLKKLFTHIQHNGQAFGEAGIPCTRAEASRI